MKWISWRRAVLAAAAGMFVPGVAVAQDWIEGIRNGEDLMRVPGTDWVIVSGLASANHPSGSLYAVDASSHAVTRIWPGGSAADAPANDCEGPPDETQLDLHGIDLRQNPDGVHDLYVVNHGGREAVEFFRLDVTGAAPALVWTGCAVLPEGHWPNDVAASPEGGFFVTSMFDPASETLFEDLSDVKPTGRVLSWTPGEGFDTVPETELSGPNGVVLSPDGRRLFVAEWATGKVVRIDLDDGARAEGVAPLMADNLNWTDEGTLLVAGQIGSVADLFGCFASPAEMCPAPWAVFELDPETLDATMVAEDHEPRQFGNATAAIRVGEAIWIGTSRGDRIALR